MKAIAVDKAKIELKATAPWLWGTGSTLTLTIDAQNEPVRFDEKQVITQLAIPSFQFKIQGQSYQATRAHTIPGTVVMCMMAIDPASLSDSFKSGVNPVFCEGTHGTFVITCTPSIQPAPSPIPDPVPVKQGTWEVIKANQNL